MGVWAIIPVKPLRRGKSRLASVLSEDERTLLNFTMLGNLLRTLSAVDTIEEILVVSRDPAALAFAREYEAKTVMEEGKPELNLALRRATMVAEAYSAQDILVLPADLPLINVQDMHTFLALMSDPPQMIISPDRRKDGTNALYLSPPGIIEFQYGQCSFHKHVDQANRLGIRVDICDLPGFGLDLDYPEDLNYLRSMEFVQ
jgi:2-phospho-L-lactate guanylyltransferase